MGSRIKSMTLLFLLSILLVLVGSFFGKQGAVIAFVIALGMNWIAYFFGDRIVLATSRAREVKPGEYSRLTSMLQELSMSAGIPVPRLYIIPSPSPNAFATGRDPQHASVAVTEGIMHLLNEQELKGVLAHELSHVKNRDILLATIAATIASAVTMLARMIQWAAIFGGGRDSEGRGGNILSLAGMMAMVILAPLAATLLQLALSRSREYLADESGARICGNPLFLSGALRKLAKGVTAIPMQNANPSISPLYIVNPFSGRSFANIFSTHPPLEERIKKLEQLGF